MALQEKINDYPETKQPLLLRLLLNRMQRLAVGRLEVDLPGGGQQVFVGQTDTTVTARWIIHNPASARRIIARGALGFAEGYIAGDWDTPDLTALLTLLDSNKAALGEDSGHLLARLTGLFSHWRRRNTRAGSRRNIAAHYDLGNDFYKAWLDETLSYSSAVFATSEQSLQAAQINKFDRMLERLGLRADHHLLEIGSGWGGFAIYAAQQTGCRVISVTLSTEQLKEARSRARLAGVADKVTFYLRDYRALEGTFDRIVSIEMMEAVGEKYWPVYFQSLHKHLKPGGYAALQVITIANDQFEDYRHGVDFIQRYIFPGGMLPSPEVFERYANQAGLRVQGATFHGDDYARTLMLWDQKVVAARSRLLAMGYDDTFLRLWHYYLAYCQAGFHSQHIDLMQVSLQK